MALILPPPVIMPAVEENYAAPDIYIDGAIFMLGGSMAHIICYIERQRRGGLAYCETARVHLPVEGMLASMSRARAVFLEPKSGH